MEKTYSVSLREYIHEGYDGYDMLIECPYITDHDDQFMLIDIMHKFFRLVSIYSRKIRDKEEISNTDYFGHDNEMKIIDFINDISIEYEGLLSLNIDTPPRIHLTEN